MFEPGLEFTASFSPLEQATANKVPKATANRNRVSPEQSLRLRFGIVRVLQVTGIVAQQFEVLGAPVLVGVVAMIGHEAELVFAGVVI